jgi:hypothetical protein
MVNEYTDGKTTYTAGALVRLSPSVAASLSPELQAARMRLLQGGHSVPGVPVLPMPLPPRPRLFLPKR